MIEYSKKRAHSVLRSLERYTKTDMVYLAQSGFWLNLGTVTVSLFSFVLYVAFAHFLPKEVYGTYQYLLSVGTIVGAFTLTGMNAALTRAVARGDEGTVRASIPIQFKWGLVPLLGSWAMAGWYFLHGNAVLGWGFLLIGIFVPLTNTLNSYAALQGGRKDFKNSFVFNFCTNLVYYPALIITAFFSKYALALLAVNLFSQGAVTALLYRKSFAMYQPNDKVDHASLSYGKHLSLMAVIGAAAAQLDNILVFHYLGSSSLAVYSFATAIPERLSGLFKFIPTAALPKFSARETAVNWWRLVPKVGMAMVAAGVVAVVYVLFANPFFTLFFPAYLAAVPYSKLYALVIIASIGAVFPTALLAQRHLRKMYLFNTIVPITQIVIQFAGVYFFGLWGLIVAKILYWALYGIYGFLFLIFGAEEGTATPQ